jgi:hypothetical protein
VNVENNAERHPNLRQGLLGQGLLEQSSLGRSSFRNLPFAIAVSVSSLSAMTANGIRRYLSPFGAERPERRSLKSMFAV